MRIFLVLGIVWLTQGHSSGQADEAILPNGLRLQGNLQGEKGNVFFATGTKLLAINQLHLIRFREEPCPVPRRILSQRIFLDDDQHLTGELLEMDERHIQFGLPTGLVLKIPRGDIAGMGQIAGWRILHHENFEADCRQWQLSGGARTGEGLAFSGRKSLLLNRPGQKAIFGLHMPMTQGRVSLFLHPPSKPPAERLQIAWYFRELKKTRIIRLLMDGENYVVQKTGANDRQNVDVPGDRSGVQQVPASAKRKRDWHQVQATWDGKSLRIGMDDHVLATISLTEDAALSEMRVAIPGQEAIDTSPEEWSLDDVQIMQPESRPPALPVPADLDTVRMGNGDQLFGRVARADGQSLTLETRRGARIYPWHDVGEFRFRTGGDKKALPNNNVDLWFYPGPGLEADRLTGELLETAAGHVILRHGRLGDLTLERSQGQKLVVHRR